MRSLSEIDTIVKRASKGVGYSWGIAEEVGKNIKLLETYGLSGLKNLSKYYPDSYITHFAYGNILTIKSQYPIISDNDDIIDAYKYILSSNEMMKNIASVTHGFVGAELKALCQAATMHAIYNNNRKRDGYSY